MLTITLPDGKNLKFAKAVDGLEIADKISKSLSKQALIMSVVVLVVLKIKFNRAYGWYEK